MMPGDSSFLETSIDAWEKEMSVLHEGASGFTADELAEHFNIGRHGMNKRLRKMLANGRCKRLDGYRFDCMGRRYRVPIYQLT